METLKEHLVAEYSGLSFLEIEELPFDVWLHLLRDAFITRMRATEKGREYLNNAWRLTQTKPDRRALREKFGKEGL